MTDPRPDTAPAIRFDDGAAYEGFMGVWSRLVGERFLAWLEPSPGGRWLDVGCGNGAFTAQLLDDAQAAHVIGIDPSAEQIAYARERLAGRPARFEVGSAGALPGADRSVDAAVMALVIFFVPDPAGAVDEMVRVTKAGGSVSAYAWDILGGGFPYAAVQEEMAALGMPTLWPPSVEASKMAALHALWAGAGLVDIGTCEITVQRRYPDFETYWQIVRTGPRLAPQMASMGTSDGERLKARVRERLGGDADGGLVCSATANAITGCAPA